VAVLLLVLAVGGCGFGSPAAKPISRRGRLALAPSSARMSRVGVKFRLSRPWVFLSFRADGSPRQSATAATITAASQGRAPITASAICSADPLLREMFRSLGATPGQITARLEIPSALPVIFGGLRVGVTLAVIGAVVAEWAGASSGLGVLINIANQGLFDTPLMFVALATLAVIGIGLHGLVVSVERRLVMKP